jgi:hypothetical protein
VKTMSALSHYDGTVVARELALATCAFEVDSADTACVVRFFGQIPLPSCHGSEGVDRDLHRGSRTSSVGVVEVYSLVLSVFISKGLALIDKVPKVRPVDGATAAPLFAASDVQAQFTLLTGSLSMFTVVSATFVYRVSLSASERAVSGYPRLVGLYFLLWKYQHHSYVVSILVPVRYGFDKPQHRRGENSLKLELSRCRIFCRCWKGTISSRV